jgi:hypothetical protein
VVPAIGELVPADKGPRRKYLSVLDERNAYFALNVMANERRAWRELFNGVYGVRIGVSS